MTFCGKSFSTGKAPVIVHIKWVKSIDNVTEENKELLRQELRAVRKRLELMFGASLEGANILERLEDCFDLLDLENMAVITEKMAEDYFEREEIRHG